MVTIQITIDEKCIGCERCYEACPQEVYNIDDENRRAIVVNEKECIVCRNCEEVCPVQAIKVKETWSFSPYLYTYKDKT